MPNASEQLTCTFCAAVHGNTHITAVGIAQPSMEELQEGQYSITFMPSKMNFVRVKVVSLAHAFKNNPINACEQCEAVVWAVVKELQK